MLKKDNFNHASFGSVIIGILTLGLLSFSIYSLLVRLTIINGGMEIRLAFIIIGGIIGVFAGLRNPITTEALSFAFTALIIVQAMWDSTYDIVGGLDDQRVLTGSIALGIFVLNIFTGKLKRGTAKKQIKRTIGAR